MNCQDIQRILDSADVNALPAVQRRACEVHVADCRGCASEWMAYSSLAAQVPPDMPRQLEARCAAAFSAAATARPRRAVWRPVVLGGLVLAAAAAALVWMQKALVIQEAELRSGADPAVPAPRGESAVFTAEPELARASAEQVAAPAAGFTVHLVPLQYVAADPRRLQRVRAYHEILAARLRTVPGLQLVEGSGGEVADADYRITIALEEKSAGSDGSTSPDEWSASVRAEVLRGQGRSDGESRDATIYVLGMVGDAWPAPSLEIATRGPMGEPCTLPATMPCDPDELAGRQVMALRKQVFPRDGTLERELEAQFLATGADETAHRWVVSDVLSLRMPLSEAMVDEVLARLAQPRDGRPRPAAHDRLNLLAMLEGQRHPAIVPALLDLAGRETRSTLRLEVVNLLGRNFPGEPAVREALALIAADPADPALQSAAQAGLRRSGDP